MGVPQTHTIDMCQVLASAYELGDMINHSVEVANYLYWKRRMDANASIHSVIQKLTIEKRRFAQTERFGHFHPDYHEAKEKVHKIEDELVQFDEVREFQKAEQVLDEIFYEMSETIAYAVSSSINVPSNNPLPKKGKKGCGSGGNCNCG